MGLFRGAASSGKGGQGAALAPWARGVGHVIARLLRELPSTVLVPEHLEEKGRVLDTFYIPSRYPNSHPEGAPFQHYGTLQSEETIRYAGEIIEFVRSQMA
jgi:HEPN domain-containing protein